MTLSLRPLGQTDIQISPLVLGTVKFGRNTGVKYPRPFDLPSDTQAQDLLAQAKELGINTLDTAPAYGKSEERLGKLLKGQRDDWVIIGKAGETFDGEQSHFDFSAKAIRSSVENSLRHLNTDCLDVLLLHSNGQDRIILNDDALLCELETMKNEGLIRATGMSSKTVEGGLLATELLDVVMVAYHLDDASQAPVLDAAKENHCGVLIKKALASGHAVLGQGAKDPVAQSFGFALAHPAVDAIVTGTLNPQHLYHNTKVVEALVATSS